MSKVFSLHAVCFGFISRHFKRIAGCSQNVFPRLEPATRICFELCLFHWIASVVIGQNNYPGFGFTTRSTMNYAHMTRNISAFHCFSVKSNLVSPLYYTQGLQFYCLPLKHISNKLYFFKSKLKACLAEKLTACQKAICVASTLSRVLQTLSVVELLGYKLLCFFHILLPI